ncbi:glycoside hydrolase family 2 TIM barrel-domain containing protein [Reichenbachiella sp. MALMAid0571]|uniref:glycoside hydrolase family 2 protein n=1 Tax=Reichenbachiella sp. MALMAid0571 TaxID=3143939 RepID=UPI0032DED78A
MKIIYNNKKFLLITICLLLVGLQVVQGQQTEKIYLSGTGAEDTKTWDFYCSDGMNSKKRATIEVPSCWEQQSFGAYNYGHMPFEERINETGLYRHTFNASKSWSTQQVNLVFEGVMTDALVKINGKSAGAVHQGAFYQFEYDISKLLKYGKENSLEVLVKKHSENESVNQAERKADFWVFGGIFRPVYLEIKPKENIRRVAIDAKADGTFKADIYTSSLKKADLLEVEVQTIDGKTINFFLVKPSEETTRIENKVDNPATWNPESPNLYQAIFRLKSLGKTIHQYSEKFGFRTVEVRENDGIYVNNVRIKFKGVNRHTFHPKYARTSSKALSIEAVSLMKEMNMNAVRMSHYPPEKHFLDVCDSLGLFVLDELTGWQKPSYDEDAGRKLLREMIARDVNHPSIVLWDNGNEGGWNTKLDNDFAKLDIQQRKVLHPWEDFRETNTQHYVDYNYLALDGYSKRKIYFPTELLHGLYDGGHGAGLEDYWLRMWNHPLSAGGFLWVFADEAVARTDMDGQLDADGNHAPDGIVGPYNEKEASFYTIKKVWSPIYFEKRYITSQFNGIFNIENRYHYTNLNECSFLVEWLTYPLPNQTGVEKIVYTENIKMDLMPDQKGKFQVFLPTDWEKSHVLKITAKNALGSDIATWTYPVQTPLSISNQLMVEGEGSEVTLVEDENKYQVEVKNLIYTFNKKNGQLLLVQRDDDMVPLKDGPVFVSRKKEVEQVETIKNNDGSVSINTVFAENKDSVSWVIQKSGLLELNIAYEPQDTSPYAGISFSFPEENVLGMKWMGEGPYRVWKNRMSGTNFGVWQKKYNNTSTGYSGFEYPEFKGYHAETYWVDVKGKNNSGFKVYVKSNDIFFRILTPDQPEDGRTTKVDFPVGDISFLHGINAIGTKFKDKSNLGPQSSDYSFRPSRIDGKKLRMSLVFDFDN